MTIYRTTSADDNFIGLVHQLDAYLAHNNGEKHEFYHQFNTIDTLNHVVVGMFDGQAIACGAIKPYSDSMEVKRMYTLPQFRGNGYAAQILSALEQLASELHYHRCILETGATMTDAIALYGKSGYKRISNYGQYAGVDASVCFEKML